MTKHIENITSVENESILKYLEAQGMINLDDVIKDMKKSEMNAILKEHKYAIWQAKDGRWNTNVPEPSKPNGRWRKVAPTLEALHEQIYQFYKSKEAIDNLENKTLSDLYPEWMEYKALHTKKSSYLSRIKTDWKKYYLNDDKGNFKSEGKEKEIKLIDIPIRKLSKLMLDQWVHRLIKGYDMTRKQYDNATLIVRQMLDYAVDLGIIDTNPMRDIHPNGKTMFRKVRKKSSESQVYNKEELAQLKELAWEDYHNRTKIYELAPLAVMFMFCTGLRISEVLTVRYDDLTSKGKLHISRMFCRDSKEIIELPKGTCGDRDIILTSEALHIIECAKERQKEHGREDCGYIFSIDGLPPSYHSVADLFRKYCANMEIERKSSHKARKTCISTMIDGGVNINTIREMVGHADERTTYNNYCFDRATDAEKLAKIEQAFS